MNLPSVAKIDKTMKVAKRYREIIALLVRHGFSEFLLESGIGAWAKNELGIELPGTSLDQHGTKPREMRLRFVMEELGPTFIKIGQILSTRPDLVPANFAEEFKKLQADVTPAPFEEIEKILKEEFQDTIDSAFASIDPAPLAAASLAQTHRARLSSGEEVVLKVLKPGVRDCIEADIAVMTSLAAFVENKFDVMTFSPRDVAREFSQQLEREVDLLSEGRNTSKLRSLFAEHEYIRFPKVFMELSTANVLTLEFIDGALLSKVQANNLTAEQRHLIVERGAEAVFQQCFEFRFFHADPHPGNIFIMDDEKLCFIDCGMTGRLDEQTAENLASLVSGVIHNDTERVVHAMGLLCEIKTETLLDKRFRLEVSEFSARFENSTLGTLKIGTLLTDFFNLLRKHKIKCPSDIIFLIKAISTIEGVAEELDPSFDIVAHVAPFIEKFLHKRYGPTAIAKRIIRTCYDYAELLERLPLSFGMALDRIEKSRFPIKVEHRGLDDLTTAIVGSSSRISLSLIAAALLVGSAILVLADRVSHDAGIISTLGSIGFVIAVLIILYVFISTHLRKH